MSKALLHFWPRTQRFHALINFPEDIFSFRKLRTKITNKSDECEESLELYNRHANGHDSWFKHKNGRYCISFGTISSFVAVTRSFACTVIPCWRLSVCKVELHSSISISIWIYSIKFNCVQAQYKEIERRNEINFWAHCISSMEWDEPLLSLNSLEPINFVSRRVLCFAFIWKVMNFYCSFRMSEWMLLTWAHVCKILIKQWIVNVDKSGVFRHLDVAIERWTKQ